MTKKELLQKMNGKMVTATYVGMATTDDNEILKKSIIDSLEKNGKTAEDFQETKDTYSVKGFTNFWRKSLLVQGEKGIFTARSKDYIFKRERDGENVFGSIPKSDDMEILENGFKKRVGEGQYIIYTLV